MKFGMNVYVWTTDLSDQYLYLIDRAKSLGYDGVEIPVAPQNTRNYLQIKRVLDDAGLKCTTITNVGADVDPISPLPSVRQKALDQLKWAIDTSSLLGSENMVGPYFAAYGQFSGHGPTEEELRWSAEVMKGAAQYARLAGPGPDGLQLSLEFLNRFEIYLLNTTGSTVELLNGVDEPNIGILYDTHHAHHEENCIQTAIRDGGSKISYVHFSESQRGTLGSGLVDWNTTINTLREIGYNGWVTVEAFNKNVPGLASAAHVWRNCFESPEQFTADSIKFLKQRFNGIKPDYPQAVGAAHSKKVEPVRPGVICDKDSSSQNRLWQITPSMAYRSGFYDGVMTIRDARQHGNFGVGQFAALDGELIVVDGSFYRAKSDGAVTVADDNDELCFTQLCFYEPGRTRWEARSGLSRETLRTFLEHVLTFGNSFCAFRIHGKFASVVASAPPLLKKPYPRIDKVGPMRKSYTFEDLEGTIVGYYSPVFAQDVGVPGYHLHFISDDKQHGGHVESFSLTGGCIDAVRINEMTLRLPTSKEYDDCKLP
ncbi:MAG: D-psicose/D-tagatose/L-ribulose 3-epimerase [Schlesneria sp.]|nr:D-psicose/D-tagatose/L-ribulose 3-epimerase [Schlesneria sp.]